MAVLVLYLLIIASGFITAMKIKDGFGKLLASGLVFTMPSRCSPWSAASRW